LPEQHVEKQKESSIFIGKGWGMFLHSAIVAVVTGKTLERECAACGNRHIFPPSRIRESVSCPRCGAFIAPKEQPGVLARNGNEQSRSSD
jgi:ribosomal protein S27AE